MEEFEKESGLPFQQARTLYIWQQSGWEYLGIDRDGNIDITRPDTMETTERKYITPAGIVKK